MNDRPLVSIIVVAYNNWPDLDLALESALNQTYKPIEVILVDNGSTDQTETQVLARFAHRLKYIRQPNLDLAGGRNSGLQAASGEFVQLLDGDDLLAPTKIARQVEFLNANPQVDVAMGRFRCFRSTPDVPAAKLWDYDAREIADPRALFLDRCPAPPIVFLCRRRVYERLGPQDVRLTFSEDLDYWLRAAFAGFRFALTPESWSFYRRRKGQKTEFRINTALGDYAVYTRALKYVLDEPYRSQLMEKLARMTHSIGSLLPVPRRRPARKETSATFSEDLAGGGGSASEEMGGVAGDGSWRTVDVPHDAKTPRLAGAVRLRPHGQRTIGGGVSST